MSEDQKLDMNYRFSDAEIASLTEYGEIRSHETGEILFEIGDKNVDLCVLLDGRLNVYLNENGEERRVGWLEPGQFTGDVSLITGARALIRGRMEQAGRVLHISHASLQRLLVERSGLSDALVKAFVARRAWARASGTASVVLVGRAFDQHAFSIRDLLTKHAVPHHWVEADADPRAQSIVERLGLTLEDTPIVVAGADERLIRPSLAEVAAALGLDLLPDHATADVIVVGAGPAGLAASVYAASEGLSVVTLDSSAPGGQAGTSSKIENYLGFPSGISGRELADRASVQAQKFGARIAAPAQAERLEDCDGVYKLSLTDGREIEGRAIVVASGADYRKLPIDNIETFRGRGIYYGATAMEAQLCTGAEVAIVGAGNSAGQGAVFLSENAKAVHVLYRRKDIRETMSEYLVRRLEETANIHLHPETEIDGFNGDSERLRSITVKVGGAETKTLETPFVFLFIGAAPCAEWLPESVARDSRGFIKTGPAIENIELVKAKWSLDRMPEIYETSWPRVYAVGDVRSGSVKRVASGVGEGSVVVQYIHRAISDV
ncbi:MAG: FAD-dependent oxidoreductase [Pseudomonadota bacterium]